MGIGWRQWILHRRTRMRDINTFMSNSHSNDIKAAIRIIKRYCAKMDIQGRADVLQALSLSDDDAFALLGRIIERDNAAQKDKPPAKAKSAKSSQPSGFSEPPSFSKPEKPSTHKKTVQTHSTDQAFETDQAVVKPTTEIIGVETDQYLTVISNRTYGSDCVVAHMTNWHSCGRADSISRDPSFWARRVCGRPNSVGISDC